MQLPEPRTILTLALLFAGTVISSFVLLSVQDDDNKDSRPELSLAYYLDRAELSGTGPDGELLYQVWTRRASQSMTDSSIDLSGVRMKYAAPDSLPWELKANAGRIPAQSSTIELRGNVIAVLASDAKNRTTIRTQQLNIDPTTQEANTQRKVVVEINDRRINGTGMFANLETNQLKLLSNVNGKFVP